MKTVLGMILGGGIGGLVGQSKLLCLNGECAITGSWQGGAIVGALAGVALVASLVPPRSKAAEHRGTTENVPPHGPRD